MNYEEKLRRKENLAQRRGGAEGRSAMGKFSLCALASLREFFQGAAAVGVATC